MRLLGIVDADPFHERTWSGSSAHLFGALRDRGALVGAEGATLGRAVDLWRKALNFDPALERWKFGYHIDPGTAAARSAAGWQRLRKYRESEFDVLLQIGAFYDFAGRIKRPIATYHDGNLALRLRSPYGYPQVSRRKIRRALDFEKRVYDGTTVMMTMSRWLAESFTEDFAVSSRKVVPVYAGINLPRILDTVDRVYSTREVLFVGREFERKGGPTLVAAFERVVRVFPDARLRIIGTSLTGAPSFVRCDGFVSKSSPEGLSRLLHAYATARVFAMPSLYEPFGIAFLEAMAHRTPCIGCDSCAMPEIIEDGVSGFLVRPNDVQSLSQRIIDLLADEQMCRDFGAAGFRKYETGFTWSAVASRILGAVEHATRAEPQQRSSGASVNAR